MDKSIARNAIFNVMYKGLSVIFPLVIVSYASRKLGADGIGVISSAQNLVTYFTMFAALGIPSYGVRVIAQTKKNKLECNKVFTELFLINLMSTLTCAILYFILIYNLNCQLTYLNYVFSILIFLNIFNVEWVFEAFEEYQYIALRSLIIKGISLLLLFMFVKDEADLFSYSLILCFGIGGNYILNLFKLTRYVNFDFRVSSLSCYKHLKVIMLFFGSVIAIELYSLLDVTMLTYMSDSYSVGYYSNAAKIVKMFANTVTSIGAVLLPRLSFYFMEKKHVEVEKVIQNFLNVIMLLALPACIGMILTADQITYILFGNEFIESASTVRILAPLIILMPLSGGIFGQILLTSGEEKKYLFCVSMGAILNIILNTIFISLWKQNGAAIASICTEFIVSLSMIWYSVKIIKIKISLSDVVKILISLIIVTFTVIIVKRFVVNGPHMLGLMIEVFCAVLSYMVSLVLLRHEFIITICKSLNPKRLKA